jgi:hypothetical protein
VSRKKTRQNCFLVTGDFLYCFVVFFFYFVAAKLNSAGEVTGDVPEYIVKRYLYGETSAEKSRANERWTHELDLLTLAQTDSFWTVDACSTFPDLVIRGVCRRKYDLQRFSLAKSLIGMLILSHELC